MMSKKTLITIQITLWSCILVFLFSVFIYAIMMEGKGNILEVGNTGHEIVYEMDITDINKIKVSLISQDLDVYETDGETIIVKQTANRLIPEKERLEIRKEDNQMSISKKKNLSSNFFNVQGLGLGERIEIYMPSVYKESVDFKAVSGDLKINDLEVKEIECNTTSGDIQIENTVTNNMEVETTSGTTRLIEVDVDELDSKQVSGDLELEGTCNKIHSNSVSGNVEIQLNKSPMEVKVEAVSGDIDLTLSEIQGFELEFDSVSGKLESDFELSMKSKKNYIYSNGGRVFDIKTVSGNLEINNR